MTALLDYQHTVVDKYTIYVFEVYGAHLDNTWKI